MMDRCPMFGISCSTPCMIKAALVALLAAFIMFLPLGDPKVVCDELGSSDNVMTSYICEAYKMSMKIVNKGVETAERAMCAVVNLLYDLKLQFYSVLNKVDNKDLYRCVCSSDSAVSTDTVAKRPCKCVRRCCRKKAE